MINSLQDLFKDKKKKEQGKTLQRPKSYLEFTET